MTTTTPTPREVARVVFDAVIARDADAVAAMFAPDSVDDFVAIGVFRGPAGIRQFFGELFAAFPDFRMVVDGIVATDESAVVQWHATGTFSGGVFQGIRPTGRTVNLRGVDVMGVRDGLVQHNTIYYDGASFARQIGMLPAQGSWLDKAILTGFNGTTRLRRR